jgi:hypothetical protein
MQVLLPGTGRPYLDGDSLDLSAPLAFTIPDVMTPGDCKGLVEMLEREGFDDAPISTIAGELMRKDIRNNTRIMFDHEQLAGRLYARIADTLPMVCGTKPVERTNASAPTGTSPGSASPRTSTVAFAAVPTSEAS